MNTMKALKDIPDYFTLRDLVMQFPDIHLIWDTENRLARVETLEERMKRTQNNIQNFTESL